MKIEINTNDDYYDCETCGGSFASGGTVHIDGELIIDLPAQAHCLGGQSFSQDELLVLALRKLGHTIDCDEEPYFIQCVLDET